jgi:hypothetical protein
VAIETAEPEMKTVMKEPDPEGLFLLIVDKAVLVIATADPTLPVAGLVSQMAWYIIDWRIIRMLRLLEQDLANRREENNKRMY